MTYRERRLRKAERLREWADKRETKANAQLNSQQTTRHDIAFNTQPGHIPARARMIAADDRAFASLNKAKAMDQRAAGIEAAADRAIYSDDEDAPERLRERIAELEATRDRKKVVNTAIRAARRADPACEPRLILVGLTNTGKITHDEACRITRLYAMSPYHGLGWPAYELTNLGANIRRQKGRLEEIEREQKDGPSWRYCGVSKYESTCLKCEQKIEKGSAIAYRRGTDEVKHFACYEQERAAPPAAVAP